MLVPEKSQTWVVDQELLHYLISSSCIASNKIFFLKLNKLVIILLTHFTLVSVGHLAFSLSWVVEKQNNFIKYHSHILCSTSYLDVFKDFINKNQFPQMILSNRSKYIISHQGFVLPSSSYFKNGLRGAHDRENDKTYLHQVFFEVKN